MSETCDTVLRRRWPGRSRCGHSSGWRETSVRKQPAPTAALGLGQVCPVPATRGYQSRRATLVMPTAARPLTSDGVATRLRLGSE